MEDIVEHEAVIDAIYDNKHDKNNGVTDGDDDYALTNSTIDNNEMNDGGNDDVENNNADEVD